MEFRKAYFEDLEHIIRDVDDYYAHTDSSPEAEPETLREHTRLCEAYFLKITEEKKLSDVFDRIQTVVSGEMSEAGRKCFIQMLMNVITFHDTGKINPIYQREKMKNPGKWDDTQFSKISSTHSMLSAICYLDYFEREIDQIADKNEKKILKIFWFMNAYIIAKHHGKLGRFNDFIGGFKNGQEKVRYEVFTETYQSFYIPEVKLRLEKMSNAAEKIIKQLKRLSHEQQTAMYAYEKLMFSLLVSCDYYATSEFRSDVVTNDFGNVRNIENIARRYHETRVSGLIREYEQNRYGKNLDGLQDETDVNVLRNEMYLDVWNELKKMLDKHIFFLEAPTGSGKSNTAFNLSFELLQQSENIQKIIYTYPFNTLVEQNLNSLSQVFGEDEEIMRQIAVINSTTPVKMDQNCEKKAEQEELSPDKQYVQALLNRQFMNYPIMLTTHVSLFHMMFGTTRENGGAFYQLANSVIVLDEIQSYKNAIWAEIFIFLKEFAKVLNIKVIIMSATLPDLTILTEEAEVAGRLIRDREKYFSHPVFKDRVRIHYDLMEGETELDDLLQIICRKSQQRKKILVELIKKDHATEAFRKLKEEAECPVELITGEDSIAERERILDKVRACSDTGIILVATQVVEAGVDIDMDIGYKNYSKLDSEEQFMGRINRNCRRCGDVYFFELDDPKSIYRNDVRMNKELTIKAKDMQEILKNKNFSDYYKIVLDHIRSENQSTGEYGLEKFFKDAVGALDFKEVQKHMELIKDDNWSMDVYLGRVISIGTEDLDGRELWRQYTALLEDYEMEYAEKQVKLSEVRSKMTNFIYQVKKNPDLCYNERIGDLFYIEEGEQYFEDNKLIREKFTDQVGMFIDL